MTTAGRRIHRIAVQKATVATDSYGGETPTWELHTEAFAEVLHGTGAERRSAAQEQATMPATFIVPFTPKLAQVVEKDRLLGLNATWDIIGIVPIGQNKEFHITAVRSDAP